MGWMRWDNPTCCKLAGFLINWMNKGRKVPEPTAGKTRFDGRVQYGPERTGWATYFESGGPHVPSHWMNVYYCPFCGQKLSELEEPDAGQRATG